MYKTFIVVYSNSFSSRRLLLLLLLLAVPHFARVGSRGSVERATRQSQTLCAHVRSNYPSSLFLCVCQSSSKLGKKETTEFNDAKKEPLREIFQLKIKKKLKTHLFAVIAFDGDGRDVLPSELADHFHERLSLEIVWRDDSAEILESRLVRQFGAGRSVADLRYLCRIREKRERQWAKDNDAVFISGKGNILLPFSAILTFPRHLGMEEDSLSFLFFPFVGPSSLSPSAAIISNGIKSRLLLLSTLLDTFPSANKEPQSTTTTTPGLFFRGNAEGETDEEKLLGGGGKEWNSFDIVITAFLTVSMSLVNSIIERDSLTFVPGTETRESGTRNAIIRHLELSR